MSYTELFLFNQSGDAEGFADIRNSHRGAMAVWLALERKYLPSLPIPAYAGFFEMDGKPYDYHSRTMPSNHEDAMKDIWELANDDRLSDAEQIALATTFDRVVVKAENVGRVVTAFREFEGETSLKEQADAIEGAMASGTIRAIAWNQTSVNGGAWEADYNEETDDYDPYNLDTGGNHWFLFDEK